MQRVVWLLPAPVRVAPTAITGRLLGSIVRAGPRRLKSAPAARAREAACMTVSSADVAVGEDHRVDLLVADEALELLLGDDRDAPG